MDLAERRTAALNALARRQPPTWQRYPGETQPSGDMPDDPWQAAAYLADRDPTWAVDCDPIWDLDDATYVDYRDRDLLGQHATAHQIVTATTINPTQEYL